MVEQYESKASPISITKKEENLLGRVFFVLK